MFRSLRPQRMGGCSRSPILQVTPPSSILVRVLARPWLNWIEHRPTEPKVEGSNPPRRDFTSSAKPLAAPSGTVCKVNLPRRGLKVTLLKLDPPLWTLRSVPYPIPFHLRSSPSD